jgi:hypothetical protein
MKKELLRWSYFPLPLTITSITIPLPSTNSSIFSFGCNYVLFVNMTSAAGTTNTFRKMIQSPEVTMERGKQEGGR